MSAWDEILQLHPEALDLRSPGAAQGLQALDPQGLYDDAPGAATMPPPPDVQTSAPMGMPNISAWDHAWSLINGGDEVPAQATPAPQFAPPAAPAGFDEGDLPLMGSRSQVEIPPAPLQTAGQQLNRIVQNTFTAQAYNRLPAGQPLDVHDYDPRVAAGTVAVKQAGVQMDQPSPGINSPRASMLGLASGMTPEDTDRLQGLVSGRIAPPLPFTTIDKADFEAAMSPTRYYQNADDGQGGLASVSQFLGDPRLGMRDPRTAQMIRPLPDGNYAVRVDLADFILRNRPPEQQNTTGQDFRNIPTNMGAAEARGIGGVAGIAGEFIQRLGNPHNLPGQDNFISNLGKGMQRQGDYLRAGASMAEQENPVQGEVAKLLTGVGVLGVDAAMAALAGPEAFTASFAARNAGTMYDQAIKQNPNDRLGATIKGLSAGMTSALTPELAKVFPANVADDIAAKVAKEYAGTFSMVEAQSVLDRLTAAAGTDQKIDLAKLIEETFPEAATQGVIGVAMGRGHAAMAKAERFLAQTPDSGTFDISQAQRSGAVPDDQMDYRPRPPKPVYKANLSEPGEGFLPGVAGGGNQLELQARPGDQPYHALARAGVPGEETSIPPQPIRPPVTENAPAGQGEQAQTTPGQSIAGKDFSEQQPPSERYAEALTATQDAGRVSVSILQRKLNIGYGQAARLVQEMEARGDISPPDPATGQRVIRPPGNAPAPPASSDHAGQPQGDTSGGYADQPFAVRSPEELRRMGAMGLRREAQRWGVTFDTPSTTIPRIIDAQDRWHLDQMSDKALWDSVRSLGLRAGGRQANIETLLGFSRYGHPQDAVAARGGISDRAAPQASDQVGQMPPAGDQAARDIAGGDGGEVAATASPITVEPYKAGTIVVRAQRHPQSVFEQSSQDGGLGGRWDEQAGGYLFPKFREKAVQAKVQELNAGGFTNAPQNGQPIYTPPAAITVEPHAAGTIIVRAPRDPQGIFERSGERGLSGQWNADAGGYVFSRLKEKAVRAAVEQANAAQSSLPESPGKTPEAPVARQGATPPAGGEAQGGAASTAADIGAAQPGIEQPATPANPPKAKRPRKVSQTAQRLLDNYDRYHADEERAAQDEDATESSGGAANTFRRNPKTKSGLPEDVEGAFTADEIAEMKRRGIIRFSDPNRSILGVDQSSAEDAASEIGGMGIDRFNDMLRRQLENSHTGRLAKAIDFARRNSEHDPEMAFLAAEMQTRPEDAATPRKVKVDPSALEVGDKATVNSLPVEVVEEHGMKVLRDDGELPDTPLDAMRKVPLDQGSLIKAAKELRGPTFRPATVDDLPMLMRAQKQNPKELGFLAGEALKEKLQRGRGIVAMNGDEPIGFALHGAMGKDVPIHQVWVDPAYRGKGVGRQLLAEVDAKAKAALAGTLRARVREDMPEANSLYQRAGFRQVGQEEAGESRGGKINLYERRPGEGEPLGQSDSVISKSPSEPGKAESLDTPKSLMERVTDAETAAKARLKKRFASAEARAQRAAGGKRRGGGYGDPLFDPDTLRDLIVIGGAKLLKLGVSAAQIGKEVFHLTTDAGRKLFGQWAAAMRKDSDVGNLSDMELKRVWTEARRVGRMDEEEKAQFFLRGKTVRSGETVKQTVRRETGQAKDLATAQTQLGLLRQVMKARAKGAAEGYEAGRQDTTALREELANTISDYVPTEEAGKLLDAVAQADNPIKVARAMTQADDVVATHLVKEGLSNVEKLLGDTRDIVRKPAEPSNLAGKSPRPDDTTPEGVALRKINMNKLEPDNRAKISALKGRMLNVRRLLQQAETVDQKYDAVQQLNDVEKQVRQIVADDNSAKNLRVGEKIKTRDEVVAGMVKTIAGGTDQAGAGGAGGNAGNGQTPIIATATPPKEANPLTRFLLRAQLSMQTIVHRMLGAKSDAYALSIDQVRQSQADYEGERQRTEKVMRAAYEAAGLKGDIARNDFLNKTETVKLNRDRSIELTRDQMLDIVASAGDPQTKLLIDAGIGWNFATNPRETPIVLSPREIETIRTKLTPGELAMIDAFRKRNAEMTPAAMKAKLDLSGYAPEPHENYYPRSRNRAQSEEAALPSGWRGWVNKSMENISSMEERAQDVGLPLSIKGFTNRAFEHFDDSARLIHLAPAARSAAAVWEHPDVTRAISREYGESMNKRIEGFLLDTMMARQRGPKNVVERGVNLLARNEARKWLALNPSPWAKNVIGGTVSLMPAFEMVDYQAGLRAMFSPATYRRMVELSPVAWARYEGGGLYGQYSPLLDRHTQTVAELHTLPALQLAFRAMIRGKFQEVPGKLAAAIDALPMMEWADSVPLRAAFAASEHFVDRTQAGLSPEARQAAVLKKFHDAIYATQNGTSSTEIAGMGSEARKNSLLQPLMLFKSDQNKKFNLLARMKDTTPAEKLRTIAAVGLNALASVAITGGLTAGAVKLGQKIGGSLQNPKDEEKRSNGLLWGIAREVAGISFEGDNLVDLARSFVTGKDANLSDPVADDLKNLTQGLTRLGFGIYRMGQTEKDTPQRQAAYDHMLSALGDLGQAARGVIGDPTVPLSNLGMKAYRAGTAKPQYTSPDVEWIKERARTLGALEAAPLHTLADLGKSFSEAKTQAEQDATARTFKDYAAIVKSDYELPEVHDAMKAAATLKDTGSREMQDLQKAIDQHASAPLIKRAKALDAVHSAAKYLNTYYAGHTSDVTKQHDSAKARIDDKRREKVQQIQPTTRPRQLAPVGG